MPIHLEILSKIILKLLAIEVILNSLLLKHDKLNAV